MTSPVSSTELVEESDHTLFDSKSDFDSTASSFSTQSTFQNPIYKKTFPPTWSRSGSSVDTGSFVDSSVQSYDPRFGISPEFSYGGQHPRVRDNKREYPVERRYEDERSKTETKRRHVDRPPVNSSTQAQSFGSNPHTHQTRPKREPYYMDGQEALPNRLPWNPVRTVLGAASPPPPPKPRRAYPYPDFPEERNTSAKSEGYDVPYRATNVSSGYSSNSGGQTSRNSANYINSTYQRSAGYDIRYHPTSESSAYSVEALGGTSS